jgi:hypothetical protein
MDTNLLHPATAFCAATAIVGISYACLAFAGPLLAREFASPYALRDAIAHKKPPVARLEPRQVLLALEALPVKDAESVARASELVAAGMVHYWPAPGTHDPGLEVGPLEQPDLWMKLRILEWTGSDPDGLAALRRLERDDWRTALAVGVGYCSQQALVLTGFLRERGVEARTVDLDGHVVTVAATPAGEWVLDPDYGVVLRHPLIEVAGSPELVRAVYGGAGYSRQRVERLVEVYSAGSQADYDDNLKIGMPSPGADLARRVALWGGLAAGIVTLFGLARLKHSSRGRRASNDSPTVPESARARSLNPIAHTRGAEAMEAAGEGAPSPGPPGILDRQGGASATPLRDGVRAQAWPAGSRRQAQETVAPGTARRAPPSSVPE